MKKFMECWRESHPVVDRQACEALRRKHTERQIWVGDTPELQDDLPVTAQDVYIGMLTIGQEIFQDHPVLAFTLLSQTGTDIAVYALGRSLKDPEDAAGYLLEQSQHPDLRRFLEEVLALVERAHDAGLHTEELISHIRKKVSGIVQLAFRIENRIDDAVGVNQFCAQIWQEALKLELADRIEGQSGPRIIKH